MKKALILAYYFPPLGMGGTQRPAKFVKYLPEFGWEATVVTVKPVAYWAEDKSLLQDLGTARIIRTGSWDPQRFLNRASGGAPPSGSASERRSVLRSLMKGINERVVPYVLMPDSKILWWPHARRALRKLLANEPFDLLFSTSPPHSLHLIARSIVTQYDMKWVADFRDRWADGIVVHEPSIVQKQFNRRRQRSVLDLADAVVSVTEPITHELSESLAKEQHKFHTINNGFDVADYPVKSASKPNNRIVFCHCGSITDYSDPAVWLQAMKIVKEQYADTAPMIRCEFVGYDTFGDFPQQLHRAGLSDMIEYYGYKAHQQALQHVVDADACILIVRGEPGESILPGKTFEYLGSRKPIFCISNIDDTRKLLRRAGHDRIFNIDEPESIARAVVGFCHNKKTPNLNDAVIDKLGRRNQTQQLAGIFDTVTASD